MNSREQEMLDAMNKAADQRGHPRLQCVEEARKKASRELERPHSRIEVVE